MSVEGSSYIEHDDCELRRIHNWERFLKASKVRFELMYNQTINSDLYITDFILIQTISTGSFSHLIVSQMKMNEKMYVIDVKKKEEVVDQNKVTCVIEERKIVQSLNFPFCISLAFSFHDNIYTYNCYPLVNGGRVSLHLKTLKKFTEVQSMFLTAQVVLALEYLHYMGVIFRNLCPGSIYLDSRGYVKLQQFKFCKKTKRAYTFCGGTLSYIAPEIIQAHGYGASVDWWALGILLYELNTGSCPFTGDNPEEVLQKILNAKHEIPSQFSSPLKSLIASLIEPDMTRRCGSSLYSNPAVYIKSHEWFKEINWLTLLNGEYSAPFVPIVSGPDDLTHFPAVKDVPLVYSNNKQSEATVWFEF